MNIYYLVNSGEQPVYLWDNPEGKARAVTVRGGDWYKARATALEHAASAGDKTCLVVVGHTRLAMRKPYNSDEPVLASAFDCHGVLGYLERLLDEVAVAVQLPPIGAALRMHSGWYEQHPVPPMMAAYKLGPCMTQPYQEASLGYNLVKKGYRVITLTDCGYEQLGPTVLDEYGTPAKWKRAYDAFIKEFL